MIMVSTINMGQQAAKGVEANTTERPEGEARLSERGQQVTRRLWPSITPQVSPSGQTAWPIAVHSGHDSTAYPLPREILNLRDSPLT
ncbi:hypothetical protein ElyMa_000249100 [Elysia marginata]|uniref:Uncharacterized protein n=1 Tax=Elysia marginata TaxID=1093978 RepID=A0AAV4F1N9_9GAST|nr:hypothetical protein ElyMa_000249100 [Elysia marginata]